LHAKYDDMQEPENVINNPVAAKSVFEMLTVANDFCSFLEKSEDFAKIGILIYLQRVLPLIYIKSSLLPDVVIEDEEAIEHYVTETEWEEIFNMLRAKFGEDDIHYYVDNHERSHQDPVRASIAENITDIYQDLKDFLLLYQKPLTTFKQNAVMECKRLFAERYGFRIVNAHSAIHYLLFKEEGPGSFSQIFAEE
jgi:hypothetical protein